MIVEARAIRLFRSCDLDGSGMIGISELEVALMINDIVPTTSYLTPLDSFYIFDLDGGGDISWVEFKVSANSEGQVKHPSTGFFRCKGVRRGEGTARHTDQLLCFRRFRCVDFL